MDPVTEELTQDETQTEETQVEEPIVEEVTEEVTTETTEPESVEIQIGDEKTEPEAKAPQWVRDLREQNKALARENRALKQQGTPAALSIGKKPTMADHDFDAALYEAALADWMQKQREIEQREAETAKQIKTQQEAWNAKLGHYNVAKAELKAKLPDYDEAEEVVKETLSEQQQVIIVKGCKNPALVVAAIGHNRKKAEELRAITDPIEFAFAVATVETQLRITPKKSVPPPEGKIEGGGAPKPGAVDSTLDKLRAEADKTGDFTKVLDYKRKKRA